MKILLVGATGTVGRAAHEALVARGHEVVAAHRSSPEYPVDLADPDSIQRVLDKAGPLDATVCAAGTTPYAPWDDLDRDAWMTGINSKLLGQVELVRRATGVVRPGGSFTVITGILAREPIRTGSVAAAVNGALEAWVVASAALLLAGDVEPSPLGYGFVVVQAIAVAALAEMQYMGLRRVA